MAGIVTYRLNDQEATYRRASISSDKFVAAETALRQNIVSARIGLVQDYDDTARLSGEVEAAFAQLQTDGSRLPDQAGRLSRIGAGVADQLAVIEQFKTRNAVLRNALAAFGVLNARLDPGALSPSLEAAVTRLGMAILELTLNTAPDVVTRVSQQISALPLAGPSDPAETSPLLRQARMIRDGLPAMDAALRVLMSTPNDSEIQVFREVVLARQEAVQAAAAHYRYALSVIAGVLILLLIRLGFMLRTRIRTLRRRVGFERALAEMSARLSDPTRTGGERQISDALAMLGAITGGDRACVILGMDPAETYRWQHLDAAADEDWVPDILQFVQPGTGVETKLIYIDGTGSTGRTLLQSTGLQGLVAARRDPIGILAIGWSQGPVSLARSETAMLTVALDLFIQTYRQIQLARDHGRLENSLRKARRMETLGAFASGIAHNFNNVLAAIMGHAEIAQLGRHGRDKEAPNLEAIRIAGARGQDLVAGIMAFGRRDLEAPQRLDGRALLLETETLLRASWPNDVALTIDAGWLDVPIAGNATQLQQVFLNTCRNAAQAVTAPGDVQVSLETMTVAEPVTLSHGSVQPGPFARFQVIDTGRGMDRETMDQIFEPFFSAREGGNGLGLATAWEIVRDHNGAWNVSSTLGQGSIFEIWLPLEPLHHADHASAELASPPGEGQAVLLINPNPQFLLRDEEVVAAFGFEPTGFDDAAAALAACQDDPGRFSAIVILGVRRWPDLPRFVSALHLCAPAAPILLAVEMSAAIDLEGAEPGGAL